MMTDDSTEEHKNVAIQVCLREKKKLYLSKSADSSFIFIDHIVHQPLQTYLRCVQIF